MRTSLMLTLAVLLLCYAPARASYTEGYYINEAYIDQNYWNGFTFCENPGFASRSDDGAGSAFGLRVSNTYEAGITMGVSVGEFEAATSPWSGTFVDNIYADVSNPNIHGETFYPVQSPAPSGQISYGEAVDSNNDYRDAWINGQDVVKNLFAGIGTEQSMVVGLFQTGVPGQQILYFPSFTSGVTCSGMQFYGPSTGGKYVFWPSSNEYLSTLVGDPPDEKTASGSYSYPSSNPNLTIHP